MVQHALLALAVAGSALQGSAGMMAKPEIVTAGCGDSFVRVGNFFTGGYFVGPQGLSFCKRGSEMLFMVDGECTGEAISCGVRAPRRAGNARSAPSKHEEPESSLPTFLQKQQALRKSTAGRASPPPAKLTNLVLMIKFNDTKTSDINPVTDFEELFNSEKGPSKVIFAESVRTYYSKVSHGRLTIDNVLTGWIDLPFSESYVAGPCTPLTQPDPNDKDGLDCPNGLHVDEAIMEGLRLFEIKVNNSEYFKKFDADGDGFIDMFTVIHSGNGAESTAGEGILGETIWSHKSSIVAPDYETRCSMYPEWTPPFIECAAYALPNSGLRIFDYNISPGRWFEGNLTYIEPGVRIAHIGVFCHEMGHFLGLPDYYDTDFSSVGLSVYSLMANSWGKDGTQNHPASFDAVCKYQMGWVDAVDLAQLTNGKGASGFKGTYKLPAVQDTPAVYMYSFSETEFIMLENRQPVFVDDLLEGGVLIYHVDFNARQRNELRPFNSSSWATVHPQIRLIQPDNRFDMELSFGRAPRATRYMGDKGDWWPFTNATTNVTAEFSDKLAPMPNFNTYAKLGQRSGLKLSNFSPSGPLMTFDFELAAPTAAPTTAAPTTAAPTAPTTLAPSAAPTVNSTTAAPTTAAPTDNSTTAAPTIATNNNTAALVIGVVGGLALSIGLIFLGIKMFKPKEEQETRLAPGSYASNPKFDAKQGPQYE